jgi:hypothetical protein
MGTFISVDQKEFNEKYMDAGRAFIGTLDEMLSGNASLFKLPPTVTLILMNYKLYCDLEFIAGYLCGVRASGSYSPSMYSMARYLFNNTAAWQQLIEAMPHFFESDLSKFSATLKDARNSLMLQVSSPSNTSEYEKSAISPEVKVNTCFKKPLLVSNEDLNNSLPGEFLGIADAAKRIGISVTTLKRRGMAGVIQMYKHSSIDKFYFKPEHLDEYVKREWVKFEAKIQRQVGLRDKFDEIRWNKKWE